MVDTEFRQPCGRRSLVWRRAAFAALVLTVVTAAMATLAAALGADGLSAFDAVILLAFLVTLPWNVINFLNSAIGFVITCSVRDPAAAVVPQLRTLDRTAALRGRTALVMPVHEEEPERVFRHLRAMLRSLDATGEAGRFDVFLLSDTRTPATATRELELFRAWQASDPAPQRLHYRRRATNVGAKSGNLWDFLETAGDRFDYFLVLDADSLMSGAAITRAVRLMDANPRLGILQTLVMGLPSSSAFSRIFQYGMRHGLRAYTIGSAWWQGDGGPYWGHNAILRTAAFKAHCRLPLLPGRPPFGGRILSHDQVEAVLMRRAGYEVRVVPDEYGSFEENPPTLPDFLARDLRWCQGNMQYGKLLGLPGLPPLGRVQLLLAMLMYIQAPAWMLFMFLGLTQAAAVQLGWMTPGLAPTAAEAAAARDLGIGLFIAVMTMVFAPKLAGFAQALLQPATRRAYGGGVLVLVSAMVELVFSLLLAPVMAVLHSRFILGMFFGRTVIWTAQVRAARSVSLREAVRNLWPPMLIGLVLPLLAWLVAPGAIPWLVPVTVGMVGAPLFAWATALPGLGRWLRRHRICALSEEFDAPDEVRAAGFAPLRPTARPTAGTGQPQRFAAAPHAAGEPVANMQKSD